MEESQNPAQNTNLSLAPAASPLEAPAEALTTPLERLGFESPGSLPSADSPIQDVLLYALVPHGGPRPDLAMVLAVACELEAMMSMAEGPMQIIFELLSRRLRAAVDLSERISAAEAEAETA